VVSRQEAEQRLLQAPWRQDDDLQRLFDVLEGARGRVRAVGGVVRDTLMAHDRTSTDIDLATELTPQEVIARTKAAGIAAYPTGIEHGTVTVRAGACVAEVTTLREDVETDGRHAVVRFGTDWSRDAARRDFTLNALYCSADGSLFDPLGGIEDCLAARIRFIGDADRRIAEDRLRVYRFFRFSASHGHQHFDPDGLEACRGAAGALSNLSAERVGSEMTRMLSLVKVARTIEQMAGIGIVDFARERLGQLAAYETLAQFPRRGGRLALLAGIGGEAALQRLWRLSNDDTQAAENTNKAAALINLGALNEAVYRYPQQVEDAVAIAAAIGGRAAEEVAQNRQRLKTLIVPRFPVSGADLLRHGMKPGKAVGQELARLERIWIESGFLLDRDELLGRIGA